jgi:putative N6-adenine-specific DNA methylase
VDTSGELLHRRGYRQETAHAPLRETLAAGILRLAEYDPQRPVVDPLCGSGVFAAEAALIALHRAPGRSRTFAFQKFASFESETWTRLCREADAAALAALPAPIVAADISAQAVDAARGNLARAGLAEMIALTQGDFADAAPETAGVDTGAPGKSDGLVVMNPPYGGRVGAGEPLDVLYARLGDALRRRWRGWRFAILAESEPLFRKMALREDAAFALLNGGRNVTLFVGRAEVRGGGRTGGR